MLVINHDSPLIEFLCMKHIKRINPHKGNYLEFLEKEQPSQIGVSAMHKEDNAMLSYEFLDAKFTLESHHPLPVLGKPTLYWCIQFCD